MTEREEEQPEIKVTDRRKFNLDGSLKEGVVIEPEKPKEEAKPEPIQPPASTEIPTDESFDLDSAQTAPDESGEADFDDDEEIPGADDPASFVNFLSTLATNAAASLGAVPHPATGKRSLDLDTGKYWLDVLGMIREKTKGNLHPQEARLLDGLLADLRMQYVTVVRATEDKLKEQAAKKFSGADILGKK